jgi:hypothetical protein
MRIILKLSQKYTRGFSVVTAMVMMGIVSIILLGMVSLTIYSIKTQGTLPVQTDTTNLLNLIQFALKNTDICSGNFSQLPPIQKSTSAIPVPSINYFNGLTKGNIILQPGQTFGGILIASMELLPVTILSSFGPEFITYGSGQIMARLRVNTQRSGNGLGPPQLASLQDMPLTLQINFNGSSDDIVGCFNPLPPQPPTGKLCGFSDKTDPQCGVPPEILAPCMGNDPRVSCPAAYQSQKVGVENCHTFYSCVHI